MSDEEWGNISIKTFETLNIEQYYITYLIVCNIAVTYLYRDACLLTWMPYMLSFSD